MMPIPPAPPLPEAIESYVKKKYPMPDDHYKKVYEFLDVPPPPRVKETAEKLEKLDEARNVPKVKISGWKKVFKFMKVPPAPHKEEEEEKEEGEEE